MNTIAMPFRPEAVSSLDCADRTWARNAIGILEGDARRSADTHLVNPVFKGLKGIAVYFKDESTHPTGSLKHRLARSLFLYGICNGRIGKGTTLVEASSGSTAVSEAYFANLLDLPFGESQFDLVLCLEVLEHIPDPAAGGRRDLP